MKAPNETKDLWIYHPQYFESYYFLATGLQADQDYEFKLVAENTNGQGIFADPVAVHTCGPLGRMDRPQVVEMQETYIEISWVKPTSLGGCPLKYYKVYIHLLDAVGPFTPVATL